MLCKNKIQDKELNALMESLQNVSISAPYFSMIKDGVTLSSIQRHESNLLLTQNKFKEFYEFYRNAFDAMAVVIKDKI